MALRKNQKTVIWISESADSEKAPSAATVIEKIGFMTAALPEMYLYPVLRAVVAKVYDPELLKNYFQHLGGAHNNVESYTKQVSAAEMKKFITLGLEDRKTYRVSDRKKQLNEKELESLKKTLEEKDLSPAFTQSVLDSYAAFDHGQVLLSTSLMYDMVEFFPNSRTTAVSKEAQEKACDLQLKVISFLLDLFRCDSAHYPDMDHTVLSLCVDAYNQERDRLSKPFFSWPPVARVD